MRIGKFVELLNTTKDTVRHYEDLNLVTPKWENHHKEYGEKEILNFHVVKELQEYGLSLKDIQIIFNLKEAYQCGDKKLIHQVLEQLTDHVNNLRKEEEEVRRRRIALENKLKEIGDFL